MARHVPEGPLSAEDEAYLRMRGRDQAADRLLELYGGDSAPAEEEPEDVEDEEPEGDTYDDSKIWKIDDLKGELAERGLPQDGTRKDLVARLRADDERRLNAGE